MIGELSQKQKDFLFGQRAWINVLHGSVRSSKTTVANLAWLKYISEYTSNEPLLMFGKTERTLKRNVLNPIGDLLGTEISTGGGEFELWGKQIHLVGANDERAVAKIQGPTYGGCYGDEWTLAPRSFTNMLFTRLSVDGAQAFLTCNPEGPYHYCKKDYLDNENIDLLDWHFTLDDNIHLPESYVENLKRTYTGLFYKRFILGLWVKAEGAVYDMFDEKKHVVSEIDYSNIVRYWVGVDYGTVNPTVFLLLGQHKDGTIYVMKEYGWDSKKKGRQKTDQEFAEDFKKWIGKINYSAIYIDPSAVSFGLALQRIGIRKVHKADNSVIDGIRNVSTLLSNGLLKIHEDCVGLIEEKNGYVWDETAAERGIDKPLKQDDHYCLHGDSMISTNKGDKPIKDILEGDRVLTRNGYKKVTASECTGVRKLYKLKAGNRELLLTGDHPVYTLNRGFVPSLELTQSDIVCILKEKCKQKKEYSKESTSEDTLTQKGDQMPPISNLPIFKRLMVKTSYIVRYGLNITGRFLKVITSTTLTEIQRITGLKTWSFSLQKSMPSYINHLSQTSKGKGSLITWKKSDHLQLNGISQKKEESGIENMPKTSTLETKHTVNQNVMCAETNTKDKQHTIDFAQMLANLNTDELRGLTTKKELVSGAEKLMSATNIASVDFVDGVALQPTQITTEVYNITVEGDHEYFANGILTHNCDALRYNIRMIFSRYCKPYLRNIAA